MIIDEISTADELRERGWGVVPPEQWRIDLPEEFRLIWERVSPFTMTSMEGGYALYEAVRTISENRLDGDLVECGVWKGGSCMLMAHVLRVLGEKERNIRLYDTFSGMTEPGEEDVIAWNGLSVAEKIADERKLGRDSFASWAVEMTEVRQNLLGIGYPMERILFIPGDVEETLASGDDGRGQGPAWNGKGDPSELSEEIALLRLDTDWYASTKQELEVLYPRLVPGGILIIDDYGHFRGARQAVDEYFASLPRGKRPLLSRLDYTRRIGVKI